MRRRSRSSTPAIWPTWLFAAGALAAPVFLVAELVQAAAWAPVGAGAFAAFGGRGLEDHSADAADGRLELGDG